MFPDYLTTLARQVLDAARAANVHIATAESCTGGLIAACLTAVPGSSDVVDRGYITYSNEAKTAQLGVPASLIASRGAVSQEVAIAMVEGALVQSGAQLAVSCTGIAGPGGGTADKPVGLVYIAAMRDGRVLNEEHRFGDLGRDAIRENTVEAALILARRLL